MDTGRSRTSILMTVDLLGKKTVASLVRVGVVSLETIPAEVGKKKKKKRLLKVEGIGTTTEGTGNLEVSSTFSLVTANVKCYVFQFINFTVIKVTQPNLDK